MPIIIFLILSAVGWLLCSVFFEAGFKALNDKSPDKKLSKYDLCRLWWGFLAIISFASGIGACLLNLPLLLAVALSHIELAAKDENLIPLKAVIMNIPGAIRNAAQRIKPYFKKP